MLATNKPTVFIKGEKYMYTRISHISTGNEDEIKEVGVYIDRDINTNYLIFSVELNSCLSFRLHYVDETNVLRSMNYCSNPWSLETTLHNTDELSYRINIEMIETFIHHSPLYIPPTIENVKAYTFNVGYITLCDFQVEYYNSQNIKVSPRTVKSIFFKSHPSKTIQNIIPSYNKSEGMNWDASKECHFKKLLETNP